MIVMEKHACVGGVSVRNIAACLVYTSTLTLRSETITAVALAACKSNPKKSR